MLSAFISPNEPDQPHRNPSLKSAARPDQQRYENTQKHKFTNIQKQNYTFCTSNQMGPNSPTLGFRGGTSSCKQVCLFIWRLWLLIWEEITCEPNAVSQESQKIIAPMSDWHVFATLWLRLLIWVEIKTLNHQTQENHWTTKHSWFWKAGSEAKIKPRHKRLIMRWKIIADNGIVKFMQFPETKEATTGEGVEAARSNDEKFCRRFYLLSGMLSMLTLPNKQ